MDPDDIPYTHDRLPPGALDEPNAAYLELLLGTDRAALRKLRDHLLRLGATPKETFIFTGNGDSTAHYTLSFPINVTDELENYGRQSLRLLDEWDVVCCAAHLRHVLAHSDGNGSIRLAERFDAKSWTGARTGYIATSPRAIEVHRTVTVAQKGNEPPKVAGAGSWSILPDRDAWHFRSMRIVKPSRTRSMNADAIRALLKTDSAEIASLFKGMEVSSVSLTVQEVIARWDHPLKRSPDNEYRTSLKGLIGISDRWLQDYRAVCAEIRQSQKQKLVAEAEPARSRIIRTIEPFRRIALAQGVTPVVIGVGFIPVMPGSDGPRFADHFCTQAVAYGSSKEEAQAILSAYSRVMWFLGHSGYSPILQTPDSYDQVFLWSQLLPQPKTAAAGGARRKNRETFMAAGEQVLSIAPMRQFKRLEESAIEQLSNAAGAQFQFQNTGLLGITFRSELNADGSRTGGCLFLVVRAPKLDRKLLQWVAVCESIFLHRGPFRLMDGPVQMPAPDGPRPVRNKVREVRLEQVRDHDVLKLALERVWSETSGNRLKRLARESPGADAILKKYRGLKDKRSAIETSAKMYVLQEELWTAMTGTDRSLLYKWREKAGLSTRKGR